jgi:hypothetical protein
MKIGEFYQLIRQCGCGSGLISDWCKDEKGTDIKICDRCKPGVLHKIFEEKHMDLFQEWLSSLFSEQADDGYEWVWADLLKEKGCEQVVGLDEARNKLSRENFLITCPNGKDIYSKLEDNTVYILVPKSYAEEVLKVGKMA